MTQTQIVISDRSYVAQLGDVHIQNARPPAGVHCIDPQHGGHRPAEGWPDVELGDSACSYAYRCRFSAAAQPARVVLPFTPSLDSWVAAAILTTPWEAIAGQNVGARIEALRAADGVEQAAGTAPWAPGQVHATVGDDPRFSGLARLCAAPLAPAAKASYLAQWFQSGEVTLTVADADVLGVQVSAAPYCADGSRKDFLPLLTAAAVAEREASYAACTVDLHWLGGGVARVGRRSAAVANCLAYGELAPWAEEIHPLLEMAFQADRATADGDGLGYEAGVRWGLGDVPVLALVTSQMAGLSAGRGAFTVGYQRAPIVVCYSPLGDPRQPEALRGPLCTIGRAANAQAVPFPFAAICAALNAAERLAGTPAGEWGGNPKSLVLGSPKGAPGQWAGTRLRPEQVAEVVAEVVRAHSLERRRADAEVLRAQPFVEVLRQIAATPYRDSLEWLTADGQRTRRVRADTLVKGVSAGGLALQDQPAVRVASLPVRALSAEAADAGESVQWGADVLVTLVTDVTRTPVTGAVPGDSSQIPSPGQ